MSLTTPNPCLRSTGLAVRRMVFSSLQNSQFGEGTRKMEGLEAWRVKSPGCRGGRRRQIAAGGLDRARRDSARPFPSHGIPRTLQEERKRKEGKEEGREEL